MSPTIGVMPHPETHPDWPRIEDFLRSAWALGDGGPLLGEHDLVWTVHCWRWAGGFASPVLALVAAATTRLTDDEALVVWVGGTDCRAWVGALGDRIADWAADEGRGVVRAHGRKGWTRRLGWRVAGEVDGFTIYERPTGPGGV